MVVRMGAHRSLECQRPSWLWGQGRAQRRDYCTEGLAGYCSRPNAEVPPSGRLAVEDGRFGGVDVQSVPGKSNLQFSQCPLEVVPVVAPQVGVIHVVGWALLPATSSAVAMMAANSTGLA